MSFSLVENWDGVTAPAIPSGWTVGAGFVTSTTQRHTTPNSLKMASSGQYFAVNSASDAGGGMTVDITSLCCIVTPPTTGNYLMGPIFRCSSTAMTGGSDACYWANISAANNMATVKVQLSSLISGTRVDMTSVSCVYGEVISGAWYAIRLYSTATDTFQVSVTRMSDGWMLNSSGSFQSTSAAVISAYAASGVSSGPYYGLAASSDNTGAAIYMDELTVNASSTAIIYPRRPVIARVPFQYYHLD